MTEIKIIDVPAGEAPDWVRREWVGLIMPVDENVPAKTQSSGVLGGKVDNIDDYGYRVKTSVAIERLSLKSPQAAKWWRETAKQFLGLWLVFEYKVCKLQ